MEAQLNTRKITDDTTKFYYIISAFDQATLNLEWDVQTANGSTCHTYSTWKLKLTVDGRVFLLPFVIAGVT